MYQFMYRARKKVDRRFFSGLCFPSNQFPIFSFLFKISSMPKKPFCSHGMIKLLRWFTLSGARVGVGLVGSREQRPKFLSRATRCCRCCRCCCHPPSILLEMWGWGIFGSLPPPIFPLPSFCVNILSLSLSLSSAEVAFERGNLFFSKLFWGKRQQRRVRGCGGGKS